MEQFITHILSIYNALCVFTGLLNVVNGVFQLNQACKYYEGVTYQFYALRQGYVYDYTYNYRDVSVLTEYGTGQISLTWNWDSAAGVYYNHQWRITGTACHHTIPINTILNNSFTIMFTF